MTALAGNEHPRLQLVGRQAGQQLIVSLCGRHYIVPLGELAKSFDAIDLDDSRLAFKPVNPRDQLVRPAELPGAFVRTFADLHWGGGGIFNDSRDLQESIFMHFCKRVEVCSSGGVLEFGNVARTATEHAQANGLQVAVGEYEWDEPLAAAWARLKKHFVP